MSPKTFKLRTSIFVPIAGAILAVLAVSLGSMYWFKEKKIADEIDHEAVAVKTLLPGVMDYEAQTLRALIASIVRDKKLLNAWYDHDREKLYRLAQPFFEEIKQDYRVTHFYFIDKDLSCFLRVHKPASYGDIIDRITLEKAALRGVVSYGVELGPFGTLTMRLVYPLFVDDVLQGYIELGKEVKHIIDYLKRDFGVELIFVVDKSFLDKNRWVDGLGILGRSGNWDQFQNDVVIYQTMDTVPETIAALLRSHPEADQGMVLKAKLGNTDCFGTMIPLLDAGRRKIGKIILLKDITGLEQQWQLLIIIQLCVCGLACLILFVVFYNYISTFDKNVTKARNSLLQEIDERKKVQKELENYQVRLKELVRARTNSLEASNIRLKEEIGERQLAQKELERLNRDLERRVEDKTRDLLMARDALFKKEKLTILGELANVFGHELRNPLGVIKNASYFLSLKAKNIHDEAVKDNINIISNELSVAEEIISDILEFSQFDAPREKDNDINQVVLDTLNRSRIPDEVTVLTDFLEDLKPVVADPLHIGHIFYYLIENAVQNMNECGQLRIFTRETDTFSEVIFADEGCLADTVRVEDVFDPSAYLRRSKGSGVGLVVAKGLVEANGGKLRAKTTKEGGSVFTVQLPLKSDGRKKG